MTEETSIRLKEVAEKLKGKELFCDRVNYAKEFLSKIKKEDWDVVEQIISSNKK